MDSWAEADVENFVAYHSVRTMGRTLSSVERLHFYSRKLGLLTKALGQKDWVIQGLPQGKDTSFELVGCYVAESVSSVVGEEGLHVIEGGRVDLLVEPVRLNDCDWFGALKESQANFSLGFNRVSDDTLVRSLEALIGTQQRFPSDNELPDIESVVIGREGALKLVTHLRRERDAKLVSAKKDDVLRRLGRLSCEACGFIFEAAYGDLGSGFCEVHHRKPLASAGENVSTSLDDLAVVCSNCHRMLHRSQPMFSVEELADIVAACQSRRS